MLGNANLLDVDTQDVAVTYPWLVASAFSADPQIVAWTGATQFPYPSWQSDKLATIFPASIPQLWHESIAGNASSQANLSAWIPQVVVLAGGANDFHQDPPVTPMDDWVAQYISFIRQVQSTYGGSLTSIVVVAWSRAQLDVPLPDNQTQNYLRYQAALAQAIQEQGLSGAHFLQLTADGMPLTGWCAAHPNRGAHANIAGQIEGFLQQQASGWASATFQATVELSAASFGPVTNAG
ncbi:hypothetical protein WJX73_006191 [Symbiochloris irregularis]|uniref:SGNH hydrolase-type esterase domain-containing protein n=1 Tax=Symbiochloris irregularis TaxID=706552 RepID=A0AAW1NUW5_9CHLO